MQPPTTDHLIARLPVSPMRSPLLRQQVYPKKKDTTQPTLLSTVRGIPTGARARTVKLGLSPA